MHLLDLVLWFVFVVWIAAGLFAFWNITGAAILRPQSSAAPLSPLPRVSILLAARNEQEMLPATLDSLLKLDYPDFEIILVDDDSDDLTGAIADDWARRHAAAVKLRVIHNHHLPPGWRGKVHAMSLAAAAATGEWILSTDADVVFHPSLLRQAVELALRKNVQFLSLTPEVKMQSWAEKVVLPAFGFLLFMLFPLRRVNDPRSSRAMAAGAFLLMRHADLVSLGGYARLRHTLIEDLRMAELFKRNGRRTYLGVTRGVFYTHMYENWREVFEGLARSAWEGAGCSLWKLLAGVAAGSTFWPCCPGFRWPLCGLRISLQEYRSRTIRPSSRLRQLRPPAPSFTARWSSLPDSLRFTHSPCRWHRSFILPFRLSLPSVASPAPVSGGRAAAISPQRRKVLQQRRLYAAT